MEKQFCYFPFSFPIRRIVECPLQGDACAVAAMPKLLIAGQASRDRAEKMICHRFRPFTSTVFDFLPEKRPDFYLWRSSQLPFLTYKSFQIERLMNAPVTICAPVLLKKKLCFSITTHIFSGLLCAGFYALIVSFNTFTFSCSSLMYEKRNLSLEFTL